VPEPKPVPEPISVTEALSLVLGAAVPLPCETVEFQAARGLVLAEEVLADRDAPPFDKSLMDGFAVRAADVAAAPRVMPVVSEILAGADPDRLAPIGAGEAARIMTGAPLPPGADAVVMVEATEPAGGAGDQGVRILRGVGAGENVAPRAADVRRGQRLLAGGDVVDPAAIGILAACGRARVPVRRRPRVAVLATGDELVPPAETPGPGQIRNSNGPVLLALAREVGADAVDLGIARDDEASLRDRLEAGLASDLLIVSGGVSMGTRDLVGVVLRALGVRILFDRVAIKPGKPFTFGTRGRTLVCACPGNPVSSYVVFQVFVRPALRKMMGFPEPVTRPLKGVLAGAVRQRGGRTGYHQARARYEEGRYIVEVVPTSGSADFVSCARGNALAIVPAEVERLGPGDAVDLILLDEAIR
jgi:molybdopterin molybdotransferase